MTNTNQMERIYEPAKETAKKIRQALKTNFPGVKFSVRTDVYSGGSSVDVSWTDLPLTEEVEAVVNQFKSGSFDGMVDMYNTTGYVFDGKLYVGAKYIFANRKLSEEYRQQIQSYLEENYSQEVHGEWYWFNQAEKEMIKNNQFETVEEVKNVSASVEVVNSEGITVTMSINEEKNGIELSFTGIPSEATRKLLKENGFRWSKYSKIWYIKKSESALLFAESFVSAYNDIEPIKEEVIEPVINEVINETETKKETLTELAQREGILVNESELIGRRVLGSWGVAGCDFGFITGETIYNEIIIKWDDNHEEYKDINGLVFADENTNTDAAGIYLLPIEPNNNTEVESDPYNNEVVETPNGFYCHFKSWDIETEDISRLLNKYDIPFEEVGEKFIFSGIDSLQMDYVKAINKSNGSILFDDSERYDPNPIEPKKENKKAVVLDFNSKFKQRQEEKEAQQMQAHFLNDILPYMDQEDKTRLLEAAKDIDKFNEIFQEVLIKVSFKQALTDAKKG